MQALTHTESNVTKSTAMGALPFDLSPQVINAMNEFKANNVNWIEMKVESECVHLVGEALNIQLSTTTTLASRISNNEGR